MWSTSYILVKLKIRRQSESDKKVKMPQKKRVHVPVAEQSSAQSLQDHLVPRYTLPRVRPISSRQSLLILHPHTNRLGWLEVSSNKFNKTHTC